MSAAPSVPESTATVEGARAALLYERYSRRLLGYCRRRLSSQEEAEDAVQHTFLNAYRSLRSGVEPRAEAAWLYKIAENVCHERRRSAWRRSRFEAVSSDGELREAVVEPAPANELDGLADALAQLTGNQRRAILLREWQGLSYREIAAEMETTESAVETLLFRARRALARRLDRTRASAGLDAGSLLAWGKSLVGGAAFKAGAAAVVVAAGVTAAEPAHRSEAAPAPILSKPVAPTALRAPVVVNAPARARPAGDAVTRPKHAAPRPTRHTAVRRTVRPNSSPGAQPGAGAGAAPAATPSPAPAPAPQPASTLPAGVHLEAPALPPLRAQAPPVVAIPAVTSAVPLDLPALPKLP